MEFIKNFLLKLNVYFQRNRATGGGGETGQRGACYSTQTAQASGKQNPYPGVSDPDSVTLWEGGGDGCVLAIISFGVNLNFFGKLG